MPIIHDVIERRSDLMTNKNYVFHQPGKRFASHRSVYHFAKEHARGDVHIYAYTAEYFFSMIERINIGVFHYVSIKHLKQYLMEFAFRWFPRDPTEGTPLEKMLDVSSWLV